MFTVYLECGNSHYFEGWYDAVSDYYKKVSKKEVTCPICGVDRVFRKPSFLLKQIGEKSIRQDPFFQIQNLLKIKEKHQEYTVVFTPQSTREEQIVSRLIRRIKKAHEQSKKDFWSLARQDASLKDAENIKTSNKECLTDEEGVPYFEVPSFDIKSN